MDFGLIYQVMFPDGKLEKCVSFKNVMGIERTTFMMGKIGAP